MDKSQWTFENHRKSHRVFRMQSPLPYHTHPEIDSVFRCRTSPLQDVNTGTEAENNFRNVAAS